VEKRADGLWRGKKREGNNEKKKMELESRGVFVLQRLGPPKPQSLMDEEARLPGRRAAQEFGVGAMMLVERKLSCFQPTDKVGEGGPGSIGPPLADSCFLF